MKDIKKLSTESYKGVRDFYPGDMAVQNHIFDIWRKTVEKYGFEEYGASVLEPSELYKAKSGEEIVNDQTYTFIDKGEREVSLRPEMTPTVARMVSARKRELAFPLRWYSIPNLFRYEQPQRGRLREHWQLNVDIFGVETLEAETEVIQIAYDITKNIGLKDSDFEIRINSRKLMNYVSKDVVGLDPDKAHAISKLIDKKRKIDADTFKKEIEKIAGAKASTLITLLNSKNFEEFTKNLPQTKEEHEGIREIREVIDALEKLGITNAVFDQTLMRGFDYYTGIVFEIFDKNPENRRSLCGGGRYDDLLSLFGGEKVSAVGFGMGDVTVKDVMETYGNTVRAHASADIYIAIISKKETPFAQDLAQILRNKGMRVALDYSYRKIGDQIKSADKRNIPKIIVIGEEEVSTGKYKIKDLKTGEVSDLESF